MFIDALLSDRPLDRSGARKVSCAWLSAMAPPASTPPAPAPHAVGEYRYHTVKTVLAHALDGVEGGMRALFLDLALVLTLEGARLLLL